jgi:hypothetical protein
MNCVATTWTRKSQAALNKHLDLASQMVVNVFGVAKFGPEYEVGQSLRVNVRVASYPVVRFRRKT